MLRTLLVLAALTVATPSPHTASTPLLLELFGSEGCSSCPPADALLAELVQAQPVPGARLVLLAEHVDYWDHLGWRDPYALGVFTTRQRALVQAIQGGSGLYTPMLVVDGQALCVGSDRAAVLTALGAAAARPHASLAASARRAGPGLALEVVVRSLPPGWGGRLLAIEATPVRAHVTSQVTAGENAGHTLEHTAVATEATRTVVDARHVPFTAHLAPPAVAPGQTVVVALRSLDGTSVLGTTQLTAP